jgi:type IV fimbrial biogenesis protein FimT
MEISESLTQPRRATRRARQVGFTAIELMVTVAVVAVLATMAAPSFQQLIATQRIKSVASALSESLWVARSEALKRNDNVAFNFTNSGSNSAVGDWKITQSSDGTGTALLQQEGSPSVVSTTSTGGNLLFVFNSSGRLTSGGSSSIQLSVPSANVNRWVCISVSGRAVTQSTSCS